MAATSRSRWRKSRCHAICSGKSYRGSTTCDHRPWPQVEPGGKHGMTTGAVCSDGSESAQIGPPRLVEHPKMRPIGSKCGSRFLNRACPATIGTELGSHLGSVG